MHEKADELIYGGYRWRRLWWMPAVAFFVRNWHLYKRYASWVLVVWIYSVISTVSVGLIGMEFMKPELIFYLVIGSVIWTFLAALFEEMSEVVSWEQWEGTLEYTFMAPISRILHLLGIGLMGISYSFLKSMVIFLLAVYCFKISLANANLSGALLVLAVSCLPFLGIGMIAATFPLIAREKGQQATYILQSFILLVSGVFYDVDILPSWLQKVSVYSPGTYCLRSIRAAVLNDAPTSALMGDIGILVLSGTILIPLGFFIFRWGEYYAKKNGKLKKSG